MQQWMFEVIHRKGAMHHVPDALSRMYEREGEEVAGFTETNDPWYSTKLQDVLTFPHKYSDWRVENDLLYRYRKDI